MSATSAPQTAKPGRLTSPKVSAKRGAPTPAKSGKNHSTGRWAEKSSAAAGKWIKKAIVSIAQWTRPYLSKMKAWWDRLSTLAAPLRARVLPYVQIVRIPGWSCLVLAVLSGITGRLLGWEELVALAIFLAAVLVVAVFFVMGRSTYAVELDMSRLRVSVGTQTFAGLTISNDSDKPLLPCLFLLPVGRALANFHVPRLAGRAAFEESFAVDTSRRQVIPLGPVRSSRGDALGLLSREIRWTGVQELFVHPLTISLVNSSAGFLKDLEGKPTDTLSSSDIAFHTLRDYVVGDDLRHIHWKTSARIGKLMVRQFEETRRSHLVVLLSTSATDWGSEEDFELGVSVAASLGQQAIREEKDLTIQTPVRRLRTETGMRMMDDFTRLGFIDSSIPIEQVALAATAAAPDASVAMIIVGENVDPSRLQRTASRFPVDAFTVVVRCVTGESLARSVISATPVFTMGKLEDLPRAMRSLGA